MKDTIAKDLKEIFHAPNTTLPEKIIHAIFYLRSKKRQGKTEVSIAQAGKYTAVETTNTLQGKIGTEHKIEIPALSNLDAQKAS